MRQYILMLIIVCVSSISVKAQTDYNLSYMGYTYPPDCNAFADQIYNFGDDWDVSHGSPSCGSSFNNGVYDVAELRAQYVSFDPVSDGLFINYEFEESHSYEIRLNVVHGSGDDVGFDVYAANNMVESYNAQCNMDIIPFVSDKQEIYRAYDVYQGSMYDISIEDFTPNKDYSQIWVSSRQDVYMNSGSFYIGYILIIDKGIIDTTPPTPVSSLSVDDFSSVDCELSWNPANDNTGVEGYYVYVNGNKVKDISNTFCSISGLTPCSSYSVMVKAYDAYGNISNGSSVVVNTLSDVVEYLDLNTNLTTEDYYEAKASIEIVLSTGFLFTADEGDDEFIGKIVSDDCDNLKSLNILSMDNNRNVESKTDNSISISHRHYMLDKKTNNIEIYPNPTDGLLYIRLDEDFSYSIADLMGKVRFSGQGSANITTIDLASLAEGIYLLKITPKEGGCFFRKIIKQ